MFDIKVFMICLLAVQRHYVGQVSFHGIECSAKAGKKALVNKISTTMSTIGTAIIDTADSNVHSAKLPESHTQMRFLSHQPSPSTTFLADPSTILAGMSPIVTLTVQHVEHDCRVR